MQRNFTVSNTDVFKQKVLNWLKQFNTFCFLNSNQYPANYELLVGADVKRGFQQTDKDALSAFQTFIDEKKSWLFGHLNYELITTEKIIRNKKEDHLLFPDIFFFEPKIVLCLKNGIVNITANNADEVFASIQNQIIINDAKNNASLKIESSITRKEYIDSIHALQKHIQRGDCYEINFCQNFFAKNADVNPLVLFQHLNKKSPNPFSALYKMDDKWLICASPERFIKKEKNKIISQPIKGTLYRNPDDNYLQKEQQQLLQSKKDKAENVMVVDLVRNDLSKICKEGSVKVDELFGIYSFPQVHQMISTISGTLEKNIQFKDIINATFPMGSMTGAPKIKVMQLIDQYEKTKRGIFSGTLGYINPDGDFDFNVVIRSMMYNQSTKYLSFQAGGGITIYSDAEKEWEESLLKAKAIKEILNVDFGD